MSRGSYRKCARSVITSVIAEVGTHDLRALRRALIAAYPFPKLWSWPRKVWYDEIKVQLGTKATKERAKREAVAKKRDIARGQLHLFEYDDLLQQIGELRNLQ